MKLFKNSKRLNQRGFDHIFMAVAFVVIIGVAGAGYLVIHGHRTSGVSYAAGSGNQWCITDSPYMCLNAWGGGPRVNVWNYGGTGNNDFTAVTLSNGNTYLKYTGSVG